MRATRASPLFITSKPSPFSPFLPCGSSSCDRYLASLAFSTPRWYSVAVAGRWAAAAAQQRQQGGVVGHSAMPPLPVPTMPRLLVLRQSGTGEVLRGGVHSSLLASPPTCVPPRPSPLFFCVLAISFSISPIFSRIPMVAGCPRALGEAEI
ncbi:hypothetical protein E2C01_058548 [Portunus trituberculatus]|uniref:Uncharacterized protein n=1 Tax=Portunus trituberculatus TaxID=210409 RepID=A0A5B7H042_PORTR|nr:hypothetical protein [Portunus trituberculatus]